MAATATTILGTKTLPYVETDRAMGRNLAQTAGHYPALPMIGMGLMLVATALIIAVVRADLSVSLRGGFDAGDKAAMMILIAALAGHVYAAFQAHDAWIDATGPAGAVQHLVGRAETWATWLEGLRRFGVGLYLTSIGFGLATIIQVIRFQNLRIQELATETQREG